MTPILAVIDQDVYINNDVQVSYVVALNYWMMACNVFIFCALVEYAIAISYAFNISDMEELRAKSDVNSYLKFSNNFRETDFLFFQPTLDLTQINETYFNHNSWFNICGKYIDKVLYIFYGSVDYTKQPFLINKIHLISRILFSLLYLIFILIYVMSTVIPWVQN